MFWKKLNDSNDSNGLRPKAFVSRRLRHYAATTQKKGGWGGGGEIEQGKFKKP